MVPPPGLPVTRRNHSLLIATTQLLATIGGTMAHEFPGLRVSRCMGVWIELRRDDETGFKAVVQPVATISFNNNQS